MKKITIVWAVLMLSAPAMAVVTITVTQVGTTNQVDITAETSGEGTLPRAFALDIVVDSGQTITGISNYHTGENQPGNRGYGIFPASFNRFIDADDPCWGEPNYTPVADYNDLPSDTQPGLGTAGITIEMGSLYKGANSPPNPVTLCTITVSGDCNVGLALNVSRGKIIMEDGNEPSSVVLNGNLVCCLSCTVPDVVGMCEVECDPIIAAGFVCGVIIYDFNDTMPVGCIISQSPSAGAQPGCGTPVDLVVSLGPCVVPDIYNLSKADANTAIENAGFTVGTITGECNDVITAGNVTGQSPSGGATPGCGSTVDYTVSTGSCPAATCWTPSECAGQTSGDATCDGNVNLDDLSALKAAWGQSSPWTAPYCCADFTHDGQVNLDDLSILKAWWGWGFNPSTGNQTCP